VQKVTSFLPVASVSQVKKNSLCIAAEEDVAKQKVPILPWQSRASLRMLGEEPGGSNTI
jgi:hypothetical protein